MRVQSRNDDIERMVHRDGVVAAEVHGQNPPDPDASGDTIMTMVPVYDGAVIVTGGSLRGVVGVQGYHKRHEGWKYARHRVVVMRDDVLREIVAASEWADGPWGGDSVVHALEGEEEE